MAEPQKRHSPQKANLRSQPMQNQQDEVMTDTSPYSKHSTTIETSEEDEPKSKSGRPRQAILRFAHGELSVQKALRNPISRNDPRRLKLKDLADETWELLPGILATRPDVTCDSFLCQKQTLDPTRCPQLPPVQVKVINSDTIDAAITLKQDPRFPVAVLNMANAYTVGGGWRKGALAQEEVICYRTSLSKTLHTKHYPIPDKSVIYSPTVLVFRDSMEQGNNLLDLRYPTQLDVVSVISCAGVSRPAIKTDSKGNQAYQNPNDQTLMMEKLRIILRTAIRNKHRQIVLGALGCGVFANPNQCVADMWKTVLTEQEFQGGYWTDVVFAILGGGGGKQGNLYVFRNTLDGLKLS